MGEQQNQPFQLSFNPSLKVDFQGSRGTSDGGLLVVRESGPYGNSGAREAWRGGSVARTESLRWVAPGRWG